MSPPQTQEARIKKRPVTIARNGPFVIFRPPCRGQSSSSRPLPEREILSWQRPTFPHSYPCSIIGSVGLNFRVRDGNGCDPHDMTTRKVKEVDNRESKVQRTSNSRFQ